MTIEMNFKDATSISQKKILTRVIEIVNKIGASGGYILIVEKTEGGVLCCQGADLTDRVIKDYDAIQ